MNERIQALAVEAGLIVNEWDGFNRRQLGVAEQRFAELIVAECAKLLWTEECYNSNSALKEFEKHSKRIKQHFGIGEL